MNTKYIHDSTMILVLYLDCSCVLLLGYASVSVRDCAE